MNSALLNELWKAGPTLEGMFAILRHGGDRSAERCRRYAALARQIADMAPGLAHPVCNNEIASQAAERVEEAAGEAQQAADLIVTKAMESEDLEARREKAQGIRAARLKAEIALADASGEMAAVAIEEWTDRALAYLEEATQAAVRAGVPEDAVQHLLLEAIPDPLAAEPIEMVEAAA
jgi:hypothetical protein